MAERRERSIVPITEFTGIVAAADPQDLPPGTSQIQVNVAGRRIGLLQSRKGFLPVNFEETTIISNLTED